MHPNAKEYRRTSFKFQVMELLVFTKQTIILKRHSPSLVAKYFGINISSLVCHSDWRRSEFLSSKWFSTQAKVTVNSSYKHCQMLFFLKRCWKKAQKTWNSSAKKLKKIEILKMRKKFTRELEDLLTLDFMCNHISYNWLVNLPQK